jgi:wobble nucleotide-excising tRNase
MISRIDYIKNFGVYRDFRWPRELSDFKQFNLIYGWNYSGKTTLSRVFRCFEVKNLHPDFSCAEVKLLANNGTSHSLSDLQTTPVFRVFNSDFIAENLSFVEGLAAPILVLGADDIAKQTALQAKRKGQELLKLDIVSNLQKKKAKAEDIEKALTRYARDCIKNPLAHVNYDKRKFEPRVVECKEKVDEYLLDSESVEKYLAVCSAKEIKQSLVQKVCRLTSCSELVEKTALLLARTVTASNPIQRLKEDPQVERWVSDGRQMHEYKTVCQFCGNILSADLFDQLAGHFSADYKNLMEDLNDLAGTIQAAMKERITLDHRNDFYPELGELFVVEETSLNNLLDERATFLKTLERLVLEKQTKAFTVIELPKLDIVADRIATKIEAINTLIDAHNLRTTTFDKNRAEAFNKLEQHYAAQFVREERYNETIQEIATLTQIIEDKESELCEIEAQISELERDLSDAAKGAERINELLAAYFGKNDLKVTVSPEKRFQIVRGTNIAKNLSEGERTAIAFAYFITRVQDGQHPLAETRIVIDDPISSLDANHLFNTYALIKTQLSGCCQLFLSTHSFEFFNLIREWAVDDEGTNKKYASWKKWGVFLVKRIDDGEAVLEPIPKELLKFKSEYHFLFSTLYHFRNSATDDFKGLLSLPNVVRRFMEAFGGIMIPLSTGLKGKMDRIFPDEVVREKVWKFINHYSHNTTITRSLTIPDMSECMLVVRSCLNAIQDWNSDYYHDLVKEVES